MSHSIGRQQIEAALAEQWLIMEVMFTPFRLPVSLDAGETAAINLAHQTKADVLLMDERRGREVARQMGLTVAGVLGELIHAKQVNWIPSVKEEIIRLRQEAGFFVDTRIEEFILSQVGE